MKWTQEAETAIKKVPFFLRKKVRLRVEKEAVKDGKMIVSLSEVNKTQKRYLNDMAADIKGYLINARTSLTQKCQDIVYLKALLCQDIVYPNNSKFYIMPPKKLLDQEASSGRKNQTNCNSTIPKRREGKYNLF